MTKKCKACGSTSLTWAPHTKVLNDIQDGRLRCHDVGCEFVLGCDECSDTITVVPADEVAKDLTMLLALLNVHPLGTIRTLVAIIDEELMPNVAKIAVQDYQRLNETLIAARKLIGH